MNITCKDSKIIFVGHDVQTGEMAIKCKKRFLNSKCIIIHHMAYAEYYPILNMDCEVSEAKENLQREILQQADMVFANGATSRSRHRTLLEMKYLFLEFIRGYRRLNLERILIIHLK